VTQFKETVAFEDLQRIISNEIAGVYLARLKEFNVPDDRLRQVAEDICYDIASAMNAVRDFEIPDADQSEGMQEEITQPGGVQVEIAQSGDVPEEITDKVDQPESDIHDMEFIEEATDEFELPDLRMDRIDQPESSMHDMALMKEATDEFELPDLKMERIKQPEPGTDGQSLMDEKTDEVDQLNIHSDDQRPRPVAGVLSQSEILKILDMAKATST
jgi:hypothetical protein